MRCVLLFWIWKKEKEKEKCQCCLSPHPSPPSRSEEKKICGTKKREEDQLNISILVIAISFVAPFALFIKENSQWTILNTGYIRNLHSYFQLDYQTFGSCNMDTKIPYFATKMTVTARSGQYASGVSGIGRNQIHQIPTISIPEAIFLSQNFCTPTSPSEASPRRFKARCVPTEIIMQMGKSPDLSTGPRVRWWRKKTKMETGLS